MADIRELKDQATKYFSKGKFEKAANAYEELCKLEPKDMQMRVRLGDAYVKKGDKEKAVSAYKIAAETYARDGFLPRAIAVCKLILEVDPQHTSTQAVLAQLYAKKTGRDTPPTPVVSRSGSFPAVSAAAPARPLSQPPPPMPARGAKPAPAKPVAESDGLELDTSDRSHAAGVTASADAGPAEIEAPAEDSGLELDTSSRDHKAGVVSATEAVEVVEVSDDSGLELDTSGNTGAKWGATPQFGGAKEEETPAAKPAPKPAPARVEPPKPKAAPAPAPEVELEMDLTASAVEVIDEEGDAVPEAEEITIETAELAKPALPGEIELDLTPEVPAPAPAARPAPAPKPAAVAAPAPVAAPPAAPARVAPAPAPVVVAPPPPAPAPEVQAAPAEDDLMFAELSEPAPAADAAPARTAMSLDELSFDEPELIGVQAPATPNVVAQKPAAQPAPQAAAPAGGDNWFAPPEGLDMEPELPAGMQMTAPTTLAQLDIASVVEDEVADMMPVEPKPAEAQDLKLPEIPLFSDLSREAFIELASQCDLRRLEPGDVIVQEGTVGTSFFVLCAGKVKVCRKSPEGDEVVLARLPEGSFFGEMALLSGAPRAASVIAEEEAECLEISAALLANLQKRYPHVGQVLKKFCRQRLLANVMATSPLFRPFDKTQRRELVEKFKARDLSPGERVLEEGKVGDGLYVVMAGEFEVVKLKDGATIPLATLKEGEVFGEISLLTKSAATATVAAKKKSTVLRLPRNTFDELISTHPQVLMLVSELSDERLRIQQALEAGSVASDAEGLMLV